MNRPLVIIAGVALLAIAAVIGVGRFGRGGASSGDGAAGGSEAESSRRGAATRGGATGRAADTPADAARRLRALLSGDDAEAPAFREVDRWAGKLSRGDFEALTEGLDFGDAAGVEGWVRSALFAEWGRRDPEGAMAFLEEVPLADEHNAAIGQAWFSLFRGWAERSPMKAYEALAAMENPEERPGETAYRKASAAILEELARQEVGTAWKLVQESEDGFANGDLLAGFFAGLRDREDTERFVNEWTAARWDTEEARQAYANYEAQLNRNGIDPDIPPEEGVVRQIAGAWAQRDLDDAVSWLMENGPGSRPHRAWRASQVVRDWARANPAAALARLDDERYAEHRIFLGHGAITGDPSLATEVMAQLGDYALQAATMQTVLSTSSAYEDDAYFPAPHDGARPPDAATRYQSLSDAIATAGFPARKEQEFLERLHAQHREDLPGPPDAGQDGHDQPSASEPAE